MTKTNNTKIGTPETQYAQTRRSQRELDMARRIAAGNRKVPTGRNIQKD